MQSFTDSKTALLCAVVGTIATACVTMSGNHPVPSSMGSSKDLVIDYARRHPDRAISGPFADKLQSGEIKIRIEDPKEDAMASFGLRGKGQDLTLTIDPKYLKPEPTREEAEALLSILSHEHAHYRQYAEDQMRNYRPRGGPMTETQCALTILVEIDAYAKTCRDAKAYGWTSRIATSACERTVGSMADFFLRERGEVYPECKPVWKFFSGHAPWNPAPKAKTPAKPLP